jgi:hypothetical protein
MLSPDGQSDRFLITKDFKRAGGRRDKFVFCYGLKIGSFMSRIPKPAICAAQSEGRVRVQTNKHRSTANLEQRSP